MRTEDCQRHNGPNSWMFYFWSTVMQTVLGVVFEGRNCALDNLLSETCLFSFISVPSTDRQASYNSSMVATAIINQTTRAHPFYHDDDGDYHYHYYHCIIIIIIIIIINWTTQAHPWWRGEVIWINNDNHEYHSDQASS